MLRRAAADGFDILMTADQNLQFQQNLSESPLGVIVLVARSNTLDDLVPLVPALLDARPDTRPGDIRRIARSQD